MCTLVHINTHIHIETSHFNKIDKNKKQTKKHAKKTNKKLTQQIIRSVPAQGFRPIYYDYPYQKYGRVQAGQQSFAEI